MRATQTSARGEQVNAFFSARPRYDDPVYLNLKAIMLSLPMLARCCVLSFQLRESDVDFHDKQRARPRCCALASAVLHCRRRLPVFPGHRRHHAARYRYAVADQDRAVDSRTPRPALYRHLFLHASRRALDLELLAIASPVRAGLRAVQLVGDSYPDVARDRSDRSDFRLPA